MSMTVTATQGGATSAGLGLHVKVLTGAKVAAQQTGGGTNTLTGNGSTGSANQVSVTTTQTGSYVYVALSEEPIATAATGCTLLGSFHDTTNAEWYGSIRTTSSTGTPGATTVGGNSTSGTLFVDVAAAEILAASTIAEDASGPAYASTSAATAVSTASFTPPAGSLLVAIIASDGASNNSTLTTMAMSDTMSLTWTPLVQAASAATCYAGIFIADIPGVSAPPWMPAQAWPFYQQRTG